MRIIAAAIGAIVVAVSLPVAGAFYLADRASVKAEEERVSLLAEGLLRHIEKASSQAFTALEALTDSTAAPKCSPASIAALRSLELSSSYLQEIGFIEDGRLACTGRGLRGGPRLPPPDYTSARGVHIRREVMLEGIPGQHFIVLEDTLSGMAGVIHGNLGFDLLDHIPGLASGVVSRAAGEVIVHRGQLVEDWLERRGPPGGYSLRADGWVLRLYESAEFDYGVYAALPLPALAQRLRGAAFVFVPIGLVVSAILILFVVLVARTQLSLPAALLVALKRSEIHVLYQPIVDLHTRDWVGAEALVRWRRHDGRVVLPDVFIPIAEDSGVIRQLTERVFELVLRDVAPLVARGGRFHVGINVSAADLQSERIVELVRRQVEATHGSEVRVVEATERGLIDEARCRQIIQAIRHVGAAIAIDDFGTGYSSLSYLGTFELDYLKIDKSFVDTIGTDSPTSDVVQHIIDIARTLRLAAVAEGVETEAQADYLAERGVAFAQGWLFARPMTMADLLEQLPAHTPTPVAAHVP